MRIGYAWISWLFILCTIFTLSACGVDKGEVEISLLAAIFPTGRMTGSGFYYFELRSDNTLIVSNGEGYIYDDDVFVGIFLNPIFETSETILTEKEKDHIIRLAGQIDESEGEFPDYVTDACYIAVQYKGNYYRTHFEDISRENYELYKAHTPKEQKVQAIIDELIHHSPIEVEVSEW